MSMHLHQKCTLLLLCAIAVLSPLITADAARAQSAVLTHPTAAVAASPAAPQKIWPTSVYVHLGQTQQFISADATSWNTSVGTLSKSGFFTAPTDMPKYQTVLISAKGPGGVASSSVTLVSGAYQTISPLTPTVGVETQKQFTSPGATLWQAVNGKISSSGLYTAPTTWPPSGQDVITVYGTHGCVTTTITIRSPVPTVTGVGNGNTIPLGPFTVQVRGTTLSPGSAVSIGSQKLFSSYSNGKLMVSGFSNTPGPAILTVANGAEISAPFTVQLGLTNAVVSAAAARRFLQQAAFGPSPADVQTVQTIGMQGWLNQQFTMAPVSTYSANTASLGGMSNHFYTDAVNAPDQLRQKVAFTLSQIFVTSLVRLISNPKMILYQDLLLKDAFANYRTIMNDVTLSPAMGQYLDMGNNDMADPVAGTVANENYAREFMQLFTLGDNMLNPDGSIQYDSNSLPIPTYSQFQVTEFARVYTGWTYQPPAGQPVVWNRSVTAYGPMVPFPSHHDTGSKQLLNSYVSPAGLSPQTDLANALNNVFNHQNIAPFVSKMLIQHFVKSNPSSAYVTRVANVFINNGSGVRGDMKAIVTAILMDPEARANDDGENDQATDGHLQEPALYFVGLVRAFGGTMTDANQYYYFLSNEGENIYSAPSVFNYYSPNSGAPGTALKGPEFQLYTPNNAILRANLVSTLFNDPTNPVQSFGTGTTVDLSPYLPLAPNPTMLVNALDFTLTRGVMPADMKSYIVAAVAADTGDALSKTKVGAYLILTSSYYNVWH